MEDLTRGRLLSRPLKVRWAGWESDTLKLQQAGWNISAYEDVACMAMEIAIRNREWGAQGLSQRIHDFDYYRGARFQDTYHDIPIQFGMRLAQNITVQTDSNHHIRESVPYRAIDAMPQWSERMITKLDDLAHFASVPLTRTQEIILPDEEDVNTLLERILEKQQGARRRYFEEKVREGDHREVPTVHAQIITLRQAA